MTTRNTVAIGSETAYASASKTYTVETPSWAEKAIVYLDITAVAGTTPLTDMKFQYIHPGSGTAVDMNWNGITQIAGTTSGTVVVVLGHGYDTEDDTGPVYFLKDALPADWKIVLTFDRTTGNETYSFSLMAEYIG